MEGSTPEMPFRGSARAAETINSASVQRRTGSRGDLEKLRAVAGEDRAELERLFDEDRKANTG